MEVKNNQIPEPDSQMIKDAVSSGKPIEITAYSVPRDYEIYINNIIDLFLAECQAQHLSSSLTYTAGELLANANKANVKRVYFLEKNLDINNEDDYKTGMMTFNTDINVNKAHYQDEQQNQNYYIKFLLSIQDDVITMEIINRAGLTKIEEKRIQDKIERAKKYDSMEDAITDIDKSEGSGLGIIIIILMLKQLGLTKDCFIVKSENGETSVKVVVPTLMDI